MLRLAGSRADIVSIVPSLRAGEITAGSSSDLSRQAVTDKLGWVREGCERAGRDPAALTLSINHWLVRVTGTAAEATELLARVAARQGVDVEMLRASPAVLVGTVDQLCEVVQERREALGLSHLQLDAGFAPPRVESLYPLVAALAGR
jgi:alkanesulfonate monooxygenase SsuD/methylene tetrahydromethanopterin reductase-like flavin-dependent oxidoreductase (luciferase family)